MQATQYRILDAASQYWRRRVDALEPLLRFVRSKLWKILLWPAAAMVLMGAWWWHVFGDLDHARQLTLADTDRRLGAYAENYALRTQRAIADIDRLLLLLRRDWAVSGGRARLEGAAEEGVFAPQYVGAAIMDAHGTVLTSLRPAPAGLNFADKRYFTVQREARDDRLYVSPPLRGALSHLEVIAFSRKLLQEQGGFGGVVVVTVLPSFFTFGYTEGLLGRHGFLGLEGLDGIDRAERSPDMRVMRPLLQRPSQLPAKGQAFYDGGQWFSDGRSRIVSWHRVPGYDMQALVGIDQEEALATFGRLRADAIERAWWNTAWIAVATVLITGFYIFASWKRHQLESVRVAYRLATEDSGDGFFIDRPVRGPHGEMIDFEIVDCNHHGAELFGRRPRDLVGTRLSNLYTPHAWPRVRQRLVEAMRKGVHESEFEVPRTEPLRATWIWFKGVRADGELAVTLRDISEAKAHLAELERRSNSDALTGLPNRYWIQQYLPAALETARSNAESLAVLFIDLDGFKTVNDALGHETGDELLRTVARRLRIAVRPHDHVVRLGGDEFVVVVERVAGAADAEQVAQRVGESFRDGFHLQRSTHVLGASIGISLFPEHGGDAETLLKNADIAMYSAKTEGKGGYRFFHPRLYEAIRSRLDTEMELRRAIELHQFVIHYQPRVDLAAGTASSMEALVRWEHPGRGLTGPNAFIPLAEETGLIVPLGEQVIDSVCRQLRGWASEGRPLIPVSVNVSPRQFSQSDIYATLRAAASRHEVDPGLLEIEVTESSMMQEGIGESRVFRQLRELGVKLCIDDFGTGYSSLSQLQRLRFDVLKIDRAFVLQIERPEGDTLISSMIAMAHALGMRVVAEGVENDRQMQLLRKLGCDEGQGFYFARPMPAGKQLPRRVSER